MALTTMDSSLLIAAVAPWHAEHERADRALGGIGNLRVVGHVLWETYSWLTRSRPRTSPRVAAGLLRALPGPALVLSSAGHERLLDLVGSGEISGGATYDAVIAMTALEAGARLLSRDERAARTYRAVGIHFDLV